MQPLLAIAGLTWKAAFRFRLFVVIAGLLLLSVIGIPLLIKDDGTARGFTQIVLTYTLSAITALLGLSTLWIACGTLARDFEECQLQMVAVKPVARWQIWLGKWLGIVSLNAALLTLSGLGVYGLLQYRASHLPAAQQAVLHREVLVARGSLKLRTYNAEIDRETDRRLRERLEKSPISRADLAEVKKQIHEQVKADYEIVPGGYEHYWELDLGMLQDRLRDKPIFARVKFNSAQKSPSGTFDGFFRVGVPDRTKLWQSEPMNLAPDTFHEFAIPAYCDDKGVLTLRFINPNNVTLRFPLEDGIEVLYEEGGFALNFARGLGIIFCWMALLASLGLAAASFLSFPVAAFFSLGVLTMALASGTLANAVSEGTVMGSNPENGVVGHSAVDAVVIPLFRAALEIINLAKDFSPIDSLSTGRSITWTDLSNAFAQIVMLLGGLIAVFGIVVFTRREIASAQTTS